MTIFRWIFRLKIAYPLVASRTRLAIFSRRLKIAFGPTLAKICPLKGEFSPKPSRSQFSKKTGCITTLSN